jgi:predicted dehydrogenase
MGLGYDLIDGKFIGSAKSHVGALLAIETFQTLYFVELNNHYNFQNNSFPNANKYNYQDFSHTILQYDLLILATPTHSHLGVIRQLLANHTFKSAIVEKPCGINLVECRGIVKLLETKGVLWYANYFRSFLPNTLQAICMVAGLGEKPISAIITGYDDLLNIFSHFIHLLTQFTEDFGSVVNSHLINSETAQLTFQNGFNLKLQNIKGIRKDSPILTIIYPTFYLEFKNNGQTIEVLKNKNGELLEAFSLSDFDRYQELATREYLRRFSSGLKEEYWRVGKVHEIVSAITLIYE